MHRASALLLSALLVASCASSGQQSATPSRGGTATAAQSGSSFPATAGPGQFQNPVLNTDFPDPFVMKTDNGYYAYATGSGGQHIQLAHSDDFFDWNQMDDPLPAIPTWSNGSTWAPEVAKTSAGYVMYYTLNSADLQRQCISYAIASKPEGPFKDPNTKPFVCQPDLGGSIDATYFKDKDGTPYLIWKNDGNCCGMPTRLFVEQLSADGTRLVGKPRDTGERNDAEWEGKVVEAPTLLLHDGTYYLFYSANAYNLEFYAVGYATSKTLTGPYKDAPENPVLSSKGRAAGPGHQSVAVGPDGKLWMAYHAWDVDAVGYENGGSRTLWVDELEFDGNKPVVKGPDDEPQPIPSASP